MKWKQNKEILDFCNVFDSFSLKRLFVLLETFAVIIRDFYFFCSKHFLLLVITHYCHSLDNFRLDIRLKLGVSSQLSFRITIGRWVVKIGSFAKAKCVSMCRSLQLKRTNILIVRKLRLKSEWGMNVTILLNPMFCISFNVKYNNFGDGYKWV